MTAFQYILCAATFLFSSGGAYSFFAEAGSPMAPPLEASPDGDAALARNFSMAGSETTGFEENKGQVRDAEGNPAGYVDFVLNRPNLSLFLLEGGGMAWQFYGSHSGEGRVEIPTGPADAMARGDHFDDVSVSEAGTRCETFRMDMVLEGANPSPEIRTEGRSADYTNYYNRNVLDVRQFDKIIYKDVYPGIDWVIYTHEGGVKYDFNVHPGADPGLIQLRFSHHESLYLDEAGNLVHGNRLGEVVEKAPVSFQNGREISTRFVLNGDQLGFEIDSYNADEPLTIDPERIWSTYYGGAGQENARSSAVDASGNVYLSGVTESMTDIAFEGYQNSMGGQFDAFLVKFDAEGDRIWATYYGGESVDVAYHCAVDVSGNVYITGETNSADGIASAGHQNESGGSFDAFLVKFDGSGTRIWGTYYGGPSLDGALSCTTDGDGNVYLTGVAQSTENIAADGFQNENNGNYDAFLVKFDAAGSRIWGTYYGGSEIEAGVGCTTDQAGNVYLSGSTESTEVLGEGGHQETYGGGTRDAYLVKFDGDGGLLWSTLYGGQSIDLGWLCTTDLDDNVYMAGASLSTDNISQDGHQNILFGVQDGFLVKFAASGERLWGTYYGGPDLEFGYSCTTDADGNVYLSGETSSSLGISSDGFQNGFGGGNFDAFLTKFTSEGERIWSSYFGGSADDYSLGCAVGENGRVYLSGFTFSTNDIAFEGHQTSSGGQIDAFLAMIEEEDFGINTRNTEGEVSLHVFPNPAADRVNLSVPERFVGALYRLYDISGKAVATGRTTAEITEIDLVGIGSGIYFLTIDGLERQGIRVVVD